MEDVERFLYEDLDKDGDITSDALLGDEEGRAYIVAKDNCIVAGLAEAESVFSHFGLNVTFKAEDGEEVKAGSKVLEIKGKVRSILAGERLALNIISRMSGISSLTRELTTACRNKNPRVKIAATRKTTPGLRAYEKKAVKLGGGMPHRMGLYDGVIIKDNHLIYISIREAIRKARENIDKPIEVEVESIDDAIIAAEEKADIIMLDNMPPVKGIIAAREARAVYPKVKIEVSGGVTPENITNYTFADIISLGWLTHSVKSKDFSLDMEKV